MKSIYRYCLQSVFLFSAITFATGSWATAVIELSGKEQNKRATPIEVASHMVGAVVVGEASSRTGQAAFSNASFSRMLNGKAAQAGDKLTSEQQSGKFSELLLDNDGIAIVWNQRRGVMTRYENGEVIDEVRVLSSGKKGKIIDAAKRSEGEYIVDAGSLPRGLYILDRTFSSKFKGGIKLWPSSDNQMFGRGNFILFGEATWDCHPKECSTNMTGNTQFKHGTLMWVE